MSLVSGISGAAGPIAIWGVDVCSSAEGSELFVGKKKTHVHSLDARILYCLLFFSYSTLSSVSTQSWDAGFLDLQASTVATHNRLE